MSKKRDLRFTATVVKSIVFVVVTVLATTVLAGTIRNSSSGAKTEYRALFSDATSLNEGDDVRVSGVKVGTVTGVEVAKDRLAEVTFTVSRDVDLTEGTSAELRFRNVVGQRYLNIELPQREGTTLEPGHTFELADTTPALDLTVLFNGFQPLFKFLDPEDVNDLSAQIIAVFQGEGATVDGLLSNTASLTSAIAEKDQVIGELITNLNTVLTTISNPSDQLDTTITTLQQLVSGLAEDRKVIGGTLEGLGDLTVSVADLLEEGRAPLKGSIAALGDLSGNLADSEEVIDDFLATLPTKLDRLGRVASYGSWLNFYVCSIDGRIPMPEGYMGELGVKPIAERCL
ncbi:phospholipid/cholesterol/gamma-HCH transport system substrate-binding protein [Nocardioides daedukensis]|uniref:Phospholipid/cholesterol/gamma-HCH transport system substrate-binding protein n=1 Tax=Nocardioides daedukensis TaxID=634462 RepID=A0A7Y9S166_9ACTN|nr:MlaD family protein [Nocardioides daedukensis]NYG60025.1 phospholipid/cholesterol/gamma-HCH transport system substrate-binding protein [Nocardioides daedukensis]